MSLGGRGGFAHPFCPSLGGIHAVRREERIDKQPRINDRIRAREVRVIGENGEQLGIMSLQEALARAQERQLDLVEVAGAAQPPVAKIMDYGRYRYEQAKRDRDAHRKQRGGDLKGMRMGPNIGEHDFKVKTQAVHSFLKEGNKVRVAMWFRGRQMAYPRVGETLLRRLAESVADVGTVESPPRLEGRSMIMVLSPKKGS